MNTTTSVGSQGTLRIGLHLLLAALPLLAISAHVFGLVTMNLSAALLILPLAVAVVVMSVFSPRAEDRVIVHGFVWGMIACAVYDAFRLDTVYMLGWWADFIPTMGTWITGTPGDRTAGAVVGYLWRYVGDGGGIGIAFFVGAAMVRLHERSRRFVVLTAIGFAVFPVWAGLIATVAIAPRGQRMMFPLTGATLVLSLIGHLIFGLITGLGFWRSRSVQASWPWAPVGFLGRLAPAAPASIPSSLSFGFPAIDVAAPTRVTRRSARSLPGSTPAGRTGSPAASLGTGAVAGSGAVAGAGASSGVGAVAGSGAVAGVGVPATFGVPAGAGAPDPGSGPVVVPPPPAPGAVPAQAGPSLPLGHPSGPQPAVASSAATGAHQRPGEHPSGAQPAVAAAGGQRPAGHRTGAQPAVVGTSTGGQRAVGSRRAAERPAGDASATTAVPRAAHTPPSGETMGPETWELWQHQLATTVKGRRTHRWR